MNLKLQIRFFCMISAFVALASIMPQHAMASPSTFTVPVGESKVYRLSEPIKRVAVGNPEVADYIIINPTQLYLLGKKPGVTNLVIWDSSGNFTSTPLQVSRNYSHINSLLKDVLPNENDIRFYAMGQALVMAGSVSDALAAETVYRLVKSYLGGTVTFDNPETALINRPPRSVVQSSITGAVSTKGGGSDKVKATPGIKGVVNLLTIRDPQQVRLEVRIAEVSRSCMQRLGLDWVQGTGPLAGSSLMTGFVQDATIKLLFDTGNSTWIDAECKKGLIKILAEPTIVAMSGNEGFFLVGGKIYTPTETSDGIDYEERTYGVGLRFTPTVLDSGRISLRVAPEVSEPLENIADLANFSLSYAATTVQMNFGENLVIGGLLNDNLQETIRGIPLLSKIPILGALFRHTEKNAEVKELMIVVRPTLIEASVAEPELPTDRFIPPTEKELFIDGKLEGSWENQ